MDKNGYYCVFDPFTKKQHLAYYAKENTNILIWPSLGGFQFCNIMSHVNICHDVALAMHIHVK